MKKILIVLAVVVMMLMPAMARAAEITINNYASDSKAEIIRSLQLRLMDLLSQLIVELQKKVAVLESRNSEVKSPEVIIKEQTPPTVIIQNVVPQQITTPMPTVPEIKKEVLDKNGFFKETDVDHKKVWATNNEISPLRIGFRNLSRFTKLGDIKLGVTGKLDGEVKTVVLDPFVFGPGNDWDVVFEVSGSEYGEKYSYHLEINNAEYVGSYDGEVVRISATQ